MPSPIESSTAELANSEFINRCRAELDSAGAMALEGFFSAQTLDRVRSEATARLDGAYFTADRHNVYLTPPDAAQPLGHASNRLITSSKGCLADDQIPADSPLRAIYNAAEFRTFLCRVLDLPEIYPYEDPLSSINVHFHLDGQELGWHFDNSSFAVTMLVQEPESGGRFEYVADVRSAEERDSEYDRVASVLDGQMETRVLEFAPGALVLFRGRDALHRVTPSFGDRPRILVVFAFNTEPGVALSASAQQTFYGRQA